MNKRSEEDVGGRCEAGLRVVFGADYSEGSETPVASFSRKSIELSSSINGSQFLDYVNNC